MTPETKRKLKWKIRGWAKKTQPLLENVSTIAEAAILIQRKTPLSMMGLGVLALRTEAKYVLQPSKGGLFSFQDLPEGMWESFHSACEKLCFSKSRIKDDIVYTFQDGEIVTDSNKLTFALMGLSKEFADILLPIGSEMQSNLPKKISFLSKKDTLKMVPVPDISLPSPKAIEILKSTQPMLSEEGPRVILLTGTPGVGKTIAANYIVSQIVGDDLVFCLGPQTDLSILYSLGWLSPKGLIIDDVDKIENQSRLLDVLDDLPFSLEIVVLTANNGYQEDVLDGATIRPGRIHETWEIVDVGVHTTREAPFDQLDDETWERVKFWSAASLTEIKERILKRGIENLRLDEIEIRQNMKCTSNGKSKKHGWEYFSGDKNPDVYPKAPEKGMLGRMFNSDD